MNYNNEPCEKVIIYFRESQFNETNAVFKNCNLSLNNTFVQVYDNYTDRIHIYPVETIDSIHFNKYEKECQEKKTDEN